ncbi:MAG: hypothetical protein LBV49_03545 [Azonexus sp.]|nr:hypothetical protein [Azonexus sp.]
MNETNCSTFKKRAAALAVASCLSLAPWIAEAAGLGKITVLSGLGQPLRAELDITAGADELSGMTARLAPPEVFRQSGIDYGSVMSDLRFAVEKRPGGQAVVKVTSTKPVNEPFLDILVELNWPAGRLVREYTFLLDPQDVGVKQAPPAVNARVVDTVKGGGAQPAPVAAAPRDKPPAREATPREEPKEIANKEPANGQTHVVKTGENLRKIASETQYQGVSLEQMLVGLFRENPEAFSGKNMNRLKSGAILNLPDQETVAAIPEGEAKRILKTQTADWNGYREKLAAAAAGAPAATETGGQASSGAITPKVQEPVAPAEKTRDQVKVARTDAAAAATAGKEAAEADRIARDKALKEAQERVAMLEKNNADMQKLLELKEQKLGELQKQAERREAERKEAERKEAERKEAERKEAAKPVAPVAPPKAPEVVKPAEPPKVEPPVVEPPKVEAKPVEPPKVEEPPAVKPAEEPSAPEAAKEPASAVSPPPAPPEPVKAPKPPPLPLPVPEEPGMLDGVFADPLPLAGGAAVLALAAGYFIYRRRRSSGATGETTTAPVTYSLGPNSVFRMTGGQSVDTGNTPPQSSDFSQTGPGSIDTDEVDPVAEADVYMAYGRDTQAEEILLEAMQKDPQRLAIHAKLLEIYANRRSVKQFETLASELYAQSGGIGPEWEKVASLGAGLDPQNPLYSGAVPRTPSADDDVGMSTDLDVDRKTVVAAAGALAQAANLGGLSASDEPASSVGRDTLALGLSSVELADLPEAKPEPEAPPAKPVNLDFGMIQQAAGGAPEKPAASKAAPADPGFNPAPAKVEDDGPLDFDISDGVPSGTMKTTVVGNLLLTDHDSDEPAFVIDKPAAQPQNRNAAPQATIAPPEADIDLHMSEAITTLVGSEEREAKKAAAAAAKMEVEPAVEPVVVVAPNSDSHSGATGGSAPSGGFSGDETVVAPLSFDIEPLPGDAKTTQTLVNSAHGGDGVEFDVSLTDSVFLGEPMTSPEFDMGSINLDLGAPPAAADAPATSAAHDPHWEEVNTKLDLAKAYEEMGDLEGARELLQEVLAEGSSDLTDQAKAVLARIGG